MQPGQLIPFSNSQPWKHVLPSALFLVCQNEPVADRPRRRLELAGKIVQVAPAMDQIDHLAAEFRQIWNTGSRHGDAFREGVRGVHQSGASPIPYPGTQLNQGVALGPDGAGEEPRLAALAVRQDHQAAGHVVCDLGTEVFPYDMDAQVEARGGPRPGTRSPDGSRCEGEWHNGRRERQGACSWPSGNRYGHGTMSLPNGNHLEGNRENGALNGPGSYIGAEGGRYDGQPRAGRPNDMGAAVAPDGSSYEGR